MLWVGLGLAIVIVFLFALFLESNADIKNRRARHH